MSQISVYSELILKRDSFLAEIRQIETEVGNVAQRMRSMPIEIPIRIDDQFTAQVRQLITEIEGKSARLEVRAEDLVTSRIEEIRAQAAANPVVVPVIYQPTGSPGGGGGGVPAGGAEWLNDSDVVDGGAGGGSGGFFQGMGTRRGAMAGMMAIHGLQRLATEFDASEKGWGTGESDPQKMLDEKRRAIEHEHEGLRGASNWLYAKMGLEPTYDEEKAQLDEAEKAQKKADTGDRKTQQRIANQNRLRELTEKMDESVTEEGQGEHEKRLDQISEALKKSNEAADKIAEHWRDYGFKTEAAANDAVAHLKEDAKKIADAATHQEDLRQLRLDRAEQRVEAATAEAGSESEQIKSRQPHAAGVSRRIFAINQRVQQLQDEYDSTPAGPEKDRIGRQLQNAKIAAESEKASIGYTESQRTEDEVAGYGNAADRAALANTPRDYQAARALAEREWNQRIAKVEDPAARDAARKARDADLASRDTEHRQRMEDDAENTKALNMRAAGYGTTGDVLELAQKTKDDLAKAGNDPDARKAVFARAEAQAQAMASGILKPRVFGSWEQFQSAVMQGGMSGSGEALKDLQDLMNGLKRSERATDKDTSDKAFDSTVDNLNKAADKLLKGNVLVLKDN